MSEHTPKPWQSVSQSIEQYVEDYEMYGETEDGRDACYTPSAGERYMLSDFAHGLTADDDFMKAIRATTHEAELLSALKGLVSATADYCGEHYIPLKVARAAIAKATGGTA